MLTVALTVVLAMGSALEDVAFAAGDAVEEFLSGGATPHYVGQIIVVSEDTTPFSAVMDRLPLHTAGRLRSWRMRLAEVRLACSGLFEVDLHRGVRPRVTALPPGEECKFRDLLVEVVVRKRVGGSP